MKIPRGTLTNLRNLQKNIDNLNQNPDQKLVIHSKGFIVGLIIGMVFFTVILILLVQDDRKKTKEKEAEFRQIENNS